MAASIGKIPAPSQGMSYRSPLGFGVRVDAIGGGVYVVQGSHS